MNINNKYYSEEHIIYDENNNVKQIKYVHNNENIKSEDINNENIKNEENKIKDSNIIYYKNELYSTDNTRYDNREIITAIINGDRLNGYNYIDEEEKNKIFEFKEYTNIEFTDSFNENAIDFFLPYPDTSEIILDNESYAEKIYYIKEDNRLGKRVIINNKYKYDNNMVDKENWGINGEILSNNYKKLRILYHKNGNILLKKYYIPINDHNCFIKDFYYFDNGGLSALYLFNSNYLLFVVHFKDNGDFDYNDIRDNKSVPPYNNYESKYKTIRYNYSKS